MRRLATCSLLAAVLSLGGCMSKSRSTVGTNAKSPGAAGDLSQVQGTWEQQPEAGRAAATPQQQRVVKQVSGNTETVTTYTPPGLTPSAPTPSAPTTPTGSAPVSLTIDSSSYTVAVGQSVSFTVRLLGTPAPSGTVAFKAGDTVISNCGAVAASNGQATCTTTALAVGTYQITGTYSGDSTYSAGIAGPITQTVK